MVRDVATSTKLVKQIKIRIGDWRSTYFGSLKTWRTSHWDLTTSRSPEEKRYGMRCCFVWGTWNRYCNRSKFALCASAPVHSTMLVLILRWMYVSSSSNVSYYYFHGLHVRPISVRSIMSRTWSVGERKGIRISRLLLKNSGSISFNPCYAPCLCIHRTRWLHPLLSAGHRSK